MRSEVFLKKIFSRIALCGNNPFGVSAFKGRAKGVFPLNGDSLGSESSWGRGRKRNERRIPIIAIEFSSLFMCICTGWFLTSLCFVSGACASSARPLDDGVQQKY